MDSFPDRSNELISRLQSLRSELQTCINIRNNNIPKEDIIRPFYEAILLLDDHLIEILQWTLTENGSTLDERWELLSTLLFVAVDLSRLLYHGLRNFVRCVQKDGFLDVLLDIGYRSKDTLALSALLNGLAKAKILRPALIRNSLNSRRSSQDEGLSLQVLKLLL
jgi:hypothetical protein